MAFFTVLCACVRRKWRGRLVVPFFIAWFVIPCLADARNILEFGVKDEVELGMKFNIMVRSKLPIVDDPEISDYVREMVLRLGNTMPAQPFAIKPAVIMHNALNAFASPGGYIFVHTGLILNLRHESEVAGVVAHELAHISQRHIAERIEKSKLFSIGALLGMLAGAFIGGQAGEATIMGSLAAGQSLMLKYSRENEREADQVGLNYLIAAGYRPQGMVGAFENIRRMRWLSGSGVFPSYLSTHPDIEERIEYLNDRLKRVSSDGVRKPDDDRAFRRVQTLIRARYTDAQSALDYFEKTGRGIEDVYAILGRAIALERLNRLKESAAEFDRALLIAPNDQLIIREAGICHFKKGDFDTAQRLLDKALILKRNDLMAMFFSARILADKGEVQRAIGIFERILSELPEDVEIHQHLGRVYGQRGDYFRAYLHFAYASLYSNDARATKVNMSKASDAAKTPEQRRAFEKLDAAYKERSEYWKG